MIWAFGSVLIQRRNAARKASRLSVLQIGCSVVLKRRIEATRITMQTGKGLDEDGEQCI